MIGVTDLQGGVKGGYFDYEGLVLDPKRMTGRGV